MFRKALVLFLVFTPLSACSGELKNEESAIISKDARNEGVDFDLFKSGKNLRYCVNGLSRESSAMDVFRILLQTAELFKESAFEKVELCYRKETRFLLGGDDFNVLGNEFGEQNPMYTVRTFPEKLSLPDGEMAYKEHRGGVLYLMRVQVADFQDMNERWFMNDLVSEMEAKRDAKRPKEFAPDEEVF